MNRLAAATSPYLQQHADNPVDWCEWGEEAFAEARRRDAPMLISIGYSACHWCHVMAHESFEDPETAAVMNEHFVCVKVDREERPDVDAVYMAATQALTGQGGWPMTVFCTPAGEPFYCGTYFPSTPRHSLPSFRQLLAGVAVAWRERRTEVRESAAAIVEALGGAERGTSGGAAPGPDELAAAVRALAGEFDAARGGFGGAPKFPMPATLEQLLRHHARTGSAAALDMVERTCDAMARGGVYDQLGGGFARYSVDAAWVVPHFEKMLYDNAQLLRVYTHLWRTTGSAASRRVAAETGEFLLRELRTPEGGFASSLDADSPDEEGHTAEGAYYAWTPGLLADALGADDAVWAARVFEVTAAGTFEHGASVLQLLRDPDDPDRFADVRARLCAARDRRARPGRDDKVVAAWNGLAIAALAEAGAVLDRPDFVAAAETAADLLLRVHVVRGPSGEFRLARTSRDGRPGPSAGVLEDYADAAEGFLALYAVTADAAWLARAGTLLDVVLDAFGDGAGGLFDTADDAERLVRRPRDPTDNATPSGASAAAGSLLGYAAYTGSDRHRDAAEELLRTVGAIAGRWVRAASWGLAVAEALADGPREIAVVGPPDDPATAELRRAALASPAPGAVVAVGDPASPGHVTLLHGRGLVEGRPAAYVCRRFTCDAPVTDPSALARALAVAKV